jgi:hypothetical protein
MHERIVNERSKLRYGAPMCWSGMFGRGLEESEEANVSNKRDGHVSGSLLWIFTNTALDRDELCTHRSHTDP